MKKVCYAILILVVLAHVVPGQDAKLASGDDPVVEQRLKDLSKELRCLVCQNETLADSQAGLAEDLRREIREQIKAGKSDKEIISFLTARYGQFILYRPQVTPTTYLLLVRTLHHPDCWLLYPVPLHSPTTRCHRD